MEKTMTFDEINLKDLKVKEDIEKEIKEILKKLSFHLKGVFKKLEFYEEVILLETPEVSKYDARINYYVSAPHLRNYRVNMLYIEYYYLGGYPIIFNSSLEDKNYTATINSKEDLFNELNSFIRQNYSLGLLNTLSRKTL